MTARGITICLRRWRALSAAPIYVFSEANLGKDHDHFVVFDFVNDPIVSLPHPIT